MNNRTATVVAERPALNTFARLVESEDQLGRNLPALVPHRTVILRPPWFSSNPSTLQDIDPTFPVEVDVTTTKVSVVPDSYIWTNAERWQFANDQAEALLLAFRNRLDSQAQHYARQLRRVTNTDVALGQYARFVHDQLSFDRVWARDVEIEPNATEAPAWRDGDEVWHPMPIESFHRPIPLEALRMTDRLNSSGLPFNKLWVLHDSFQPVPRKRWNMPLIPIESAAGGDPYIAIQVGSWLIGVFYWV